MRRLFPLLALIVLPSLALACIWDYDTLKQERSRFPSALELITGKFLRHSPEFYEWRIQDRLQKLKYDPNNPSLHDDLAVAYSKVGKFDQAIETMMALEKKSPGRYETYSNLGTFYFLSGQIAKGLPYIDKALAINPDAHFGREKYQRWLGEMLLQPDPSPNFAEFLQKKFQKKLEQKDVDEAVKAILGMMRFADYGNPILLQALADLLGHPYNMPEGSNLLAARAILKKGYFQQDQSFSKSSSEQAKIALQHQLRSNNPPSNSTLEQVKTQFLEELADAEQWYEELRAKELGWIASGENPETEFDKLYRQEPLIGEKTDDSLQPPSPLLKLNPNLILWPLFTLCLILQVVFFGILRRLSRRRTEGTKSSLKGCLVSFLFVLNLFPIILGFVMLISRFVRMG
jgi:tetratricopeptide (TPR) repeat protein